MADNTGKKKTADYVNYSVSSGEPYKPVSDTPAEKLRATTLNAASDLWKKIKGPAKPPTQ